MTVSMILLNLAKSRGIVICDVGKNCTLNPQKINVSWSFLISHGQCKIYLFVTTLN